MKLTAARSTVQEVARRVDARAATVGGVTLRVTAGLLWLGNLVWKRPPDFGRSGDGCASLCQYVEDGIERPVFPGSGWFFDAVVAPNLTFFGWTTLLIEGLVAALLLSGRAVRTAAVLGAAQAIGIMAAVANTDGEWYWTYLLMVAVHVGVLALASAVPRQSLRTTALLTMSFGAALALVHIGEGLTGSAFTLFTSNERDLPHDFVRNTFGGSVLLGLLFLTVGVAAVAASPRLTPTARRNVGTAVLLVAIGLFTSTDEQGTALGIGSTITSAVILAALAVSLLTSHADRTHGSTAGVVRRDHAADST